MFTQPSLTLHSVVVQAEEEENKKWLECQQFPGKRRSDVPFPKHQSTRNKQSHNQKPISEAPK